MDNELLETILGEKWEREGGAFLCPVRSLRTGWTPNAIIEFGGGGRWRAAEARTGHTCPSCCSAVGGSSLQLPAPAVIASLQSHLAPGSTLPRAAHMQQLISTKAQPFQPNVRSLWRVISAPEPRGVGQGCCQAHITAQLLLPLDPVPSLSLVDPGRSLINTLHTKLQPLSLNTTCRRV